MLIAGTRVTCDNSHPCWYAAVDSPDTQPPAASAASSESNCFKAVRLLENGNQQENK